MTADQRAAEENGMSASASVDEYLSTVPEGTRATLQELRRTIKAAAPDAVEGFGYGLPGFKYQGRPLIYFGAAKNHCAIYGPAVDAHRDELAAYDTSKGTVRFPPDQPPPEALVRKLVVTRVAEIEAEEQQRKEKKRASAKR